MGRWVKVVSAQLRSERVKGRRIPYNAKQLVARFSALGMKCLYCGDKDRDQLTEDHLMPISKGGWYCLENLVPACWDCNSKKNNRHPLDWLDSVGKHSTVVYLRVIVLLGKYEAVPKRIRNISS